MVLICSVFWQKQSKDGLFLSAVRESMADSMAPNLHNAKAALPGKQEFCAVRRSMFQFETFKY